MKENKDISKVEEYEYDAAVTEGGDNLEKLTDEEWDKILCKEELVFARFLLFLVTSIYLNFFLS